MSDVRHSAWKVLVFSVGVHVHEIREAEKKETRTNIINALKSRVRKRRRKSAAVSDENRFCYTPNPFGYDSN